MKQKDILSVLAVAVTVIGVGAVIFNGATEAVMAASLNTTQMVPTSYQVPAVVAAEVPKDYQKAGYHVLKDELSISNPTAADLTMEEAAELGAQYLWKIYGLDLEGANIYMRYDSGSAGFPRASWTGDVLFSAERTPDSTRWGFAMDAVTGELFSAFFCERLTSDVALGADSTLKNHYDEYEKLARECVEHCGLLNGSVARVAYNGQGYTINNPDVTFDVYGENGEKILMTFSRYNQKLLGLVTDSSLRIGDSAMDDVAGEDITEMAQ